MIKTLFEFLNSTGFLRLWRELKKKDSQTFLFRILLTSLILFISYKVTFNQKSKDEERDSWLDNSPLINQKLESIRTDNTLRKTPDYCAVYVFHNGKSMLTDQSLMYFDQIFHSDCIDCNYEANLFQNLPLAPYSMTLAALRTQPYIYCSDLDKPYKSTKSGMESNEFIRLRRMLTSYGTHSIVLCPIYSKPTYILFGSVKWRSSQLIGFITMEYKSVTNLSVRDLNYFRNRSYEIEGMMANIK